MKKIRIVIRISAVSLLLGSMIFFSSCSRLEKDGEDYYPELEASYYYQAIPLTKDQMLMSDGINNFGFNLYKELNEDGNAMISPLSVSMALGMLANGTAGGDQKLLLNTLCLNNHSADEVSSYFKDLTASLKKVSKNTTVNIANSIWGNSNSNLTFNADYIKKCQDYYSAMVKYIDFSKTESLTEVNQWISDNTGGKIENALPALYGSCLLANAFYFKSIWGLEFNKISEKQMKVDLRTSYYDSEAFDMVEVPYCDSNYAIDILRPKGKASPKDLIDYINNGKWNNALNSFCTADATITMPIFNFQYDALVQYPIKKLGFDIFNADFSGIGKPSPNFDSILHKTYIDVNEKGTEAAAVTIVLMASASPNHTDTPEPNYPKVDFRVDKPFLFILRERGTGVIVAIGQYTSM